MDVTRALWTSRVTSVTLLLLLAAGALALPGAFGLVALVLAGLVAVGGLAATARLVAANRRGDLGEILYTHGARVPLARIVAARRWDRLELLVGAGLWAGVTGASLVDAAPWYAGLFATAVAAFLVLMGVQRILSVRLLDALRALQAREPERTLRLLRPLLRSRGAWRHHAEGLEVHALLQLGEVGTARTRLESGWSGAIDAQAVPLVLLRLGRGDPRLADRWLAARRPDDRYQRYLAAMVGAHRAIAADEHARALELARGPVSEVPEAHARELRLLEAAALASLGRDDEARVLLSELHVDDRDGWRAEAHPHVWSPVARILGRPAAAARPSPSAPRPRPDEPDDPFAPPESEARSAPRRGPNVGALPAEWLPLSTRQRMLPSLVLGLLAVLLAALTAPMIPLLLIVAAGGTEPVGELLGMLGVSVLGLTLSALIGLGIAVTRFGGGRAPALVLADGRRVGVTDGLRWSLWTSGPLLFAAVALVVLPTLTLLLAGGSARILLLVVPIFALAWWIARTRLVVGRVVWAVHFEAPEQAVAKAQAALGRSNPQAHLLRPWLALAHLVAGRTDEAEAVISEAAHLLPEARELRAWFLAARGEADLDRLLGREEPDELGPAFRHAVTAALAALSGERPGAVRHRVGAWAGLAERIPNRIGGLLHRANHAVLVRSGAGTEAEDYRARYREGLERGAWADAAWPALLRVPSAPLESPPDHP